MTYIYHKKKDPLFYMDSKQARKLVHDSDYETIFGLKCLDCKESLPIIFKDFDPYIVKGCKCNNYSNKIQKTDYKFLATILSK